MLLLNLEIGLITPPFAANLFVACKMTKLSIDEILKDLIPFFLVCVPVLLITTFWEPFSLSARRPKSTTTCVFYMPESCSRSLITTSGEVALKVPKLKGISFKTVAIVSCRCRESSVKKP